MPVRVERFETTLHGRRQAWVEAGEGDPIVLLHGITMAPDRWGPILPELARHGRVIAPALPGHGDSSKARGDYSISGLALTVRDLLLTLEVERATVIGHSLGGGVAMALAYVMPELVGRQVLVCTGGLGRGLSPYLRLVTLPGMDLLMPLALNRFTKPAFHATASMLTSFGMWAPAEVFDGLSRLAHPPARRAFHAILGTAVGPEGQRVTALDRLGLAEDIPTLVVWGRRDAIIPISHADAAHNAIPGSRLEIFERSGHFPFLDEPGRFVSVVDEFMASTEPSTAKITDFPRRLRQVGFADAS